MSVTIDSLDIQIRSSAGSAATNIDRLADSLEKLRNNSSLTKVSNNLKKLGDALKNLQISSSTVGTIKGLAGAMKSLASVQKANGLNSVLKSLERIPGILSALDYSALSEFNTKIRQLAAGLAPLAKEIETISNGFARLPARISQCVTATNRLTRATQQAEQAEEDHNEALNNKSVNLAAAISNLQTYIGFIHQVGDALARVIGGAMEWDGIQFRFGQAFGEDAQEVYDWILKINEALGISVQEFMQYSGIYASLLKGFGLEQSKLTEISVGLTELTYDIWAFSNDRYKNLEDAAEAVRSAITGEIEPIRNAGIALTEASMQEYLDTHTQLGVSIEKLTEAQKAEVRYAVMVNSAMQQGIVGTYAREMDTAEGAVRRLTQQLKTLGQAFGSLFIPLLQMAIPWITAFVDILTDAVHWLAALFGIKIQKIDWSGVNAGATGLEEVKSGADDATGALGDTAKAAKKLKDYTLGFDELNVIEPPSDSGGSGGSGGGAGGADAGAGGWGEGLDLKSIWDQALLDSATKQVDEIKAKILGFFEEWKTQIGIIAGALAALSIANLLSKLGEAIGLGNNFLEVMKNIKKLAATAIIITLQYSLMTEFFKSFIDGNGFKEYIKALFVGALSTWVLYSMWGPTGLVIGLGVTAAAALTATFADGELDSWEEAVTGLTGLAAAAGAVAVAWKKVGPAIKESNIVRVLQGVASGSPAANSALTFMFPTLTKFATGISTAVKAVSGFVAGISAPVWGTIAAVIAAIASSAVFLARNWDEVTAAVKGFIEVNIVPKIEAIKESWEKIKTALSDAKEAFLNAIPPKFREALENAGKWIGDLVKKIGEWFKSVDWLAGIGKAFEVLGGIIVGVLGGAISGVISAVVSLIEGFVQFLSGFVQIISGGIELIVALFTGGDIEAAWKKIWDGVVDVVSGLWDMIITPVKEFVQGIIDWFVNLWDELVGHSIVPDMIDAIVECFTSLPNKIFKSIKNFVNGVIDRFKAMWKEVEKLFSDAWSKVSEVWKKAATWFKEKVTEPTKKFFSDAWDKIKKFFSDAWDKVSDIWKKVSDWFKEKVIEPIKKHFSEGLDKIKKNFSDTWDKISDIWKKVSDWFKEKVVEPVKKLFSDALDKIKNLFSDSWDKISNVWRIVAEWFNTTVIKPVAQFFLDMWTNIQEFAVSAWTAIKEFTVSTWEGIKEFFATLPGWINEIIIVPVTQFFTNLWTTTKELAIAAWEGIKETFSTISGWIDENIIQPVTEFFKELWNKVKDLALEAWEGIKETYATISGWIEEKIITPVSDFFKEMWAKIKELAISAWNGIKDTFSTISGWIKEKIITPVGKFFSELWTGFVDKARTAWNSVKEVFGKVGQFFGDTFRNAWQKVVNVFSIAGEIFVNIKDGILTAFKWVVNGIIRGINSVVAIPFNGINDALIMLRNISILDMQPFAGIRTIHVPEIPLLANGGFVSAGQMFIANEAGAEMIGSIGGRTAVANNDQIVTAVAEGVYSAVVAAMQQGNNNGTSAVNVYLDGKQIYASVRKTESERGMKLMGSQLGYTY